MAGGNDGRSIRPPVNAGGDEYLFTISLGANLGASTGVSARACSVPRPLAMLRRLCIREPAADLRMHEQVRTAQGSAGGGREGGCQAACAP